MSSQPIKRRHLRLATAEDAEQRAGAAEFERKYRLWTLRRRIGLPEEQLKVICNIFFNYGRNDQRGRIARLEDHIAELKRDMATETTDDDGLSEWERLTRGGYDAH